MITIHPENDTYLKSIEGDGLHPFLMAGDTLRGAILNGSRMVNQMRWNHEFGILETLVLGHAYMGACLMSVGFKGKDRLALHVDCSGPIKGLAVEASADGNVRGFLKNVPIPVEKPLENFNLSPFFGAGFISVTRTLDKAKKPFTGTVMIEHGSLAKDLANYYLTSEQIPTAFDLSIKFDNQGNVAAAGGLFLQAMPDADDAIVRQIEKVVSVLPSIGADLACGAKSRSFMEKHFGAFSPRFLDERQVEFFCGCSSKQIEHVLHMLPKEELEDIRANGPFPVEIRCHHCNTKYAFEKDQVETIVATKLPKGI
jgi:molecular chaperone Hsp33